MNKCKKIKFYLNWKVLASALGILFLYQTLAYNQGVLGDEIPEKTRKRRFEKKTQREDKSETVVCGNCICETGENKMNCRKDCGINPPPYHPEKQESMTYFDPIAKKEFTRSYMVHLPASYEPGTLAPVVINFHGALGTGESAEIGIGGMNKKSDEGGFIAVYPNAISKIGQPGRKQYWNAGTLVDVGAPNVDDVGFINAMLDKLEQDYSVDKKRIYATGISNGAWMSYAVACKLSERIAAIAPAAGGMILEGCSPKEPVSIIHFHGTKDPGWPYNGGGSCWTDTIRSPIMETISKWVELDGCSPTSNITYQKGDVTCKTYSSCAKGTEIIFCTINGGGHAYPGGYTFPVEQVVKWDGDCALGQNGNGVGKVSKDISALDAMWEFFKKHPKP
ncbi:MAG: PHB depolymerase family esterase [Candidatus Omnitrophota bacterium]|jgi:polyhydroxybutyrate depolymerase